MQTYTRFHRICPKQTHPSFPGNVTCLVHLIQMDLLGLEPRASASFDGQLFYLSDCKGSDLPTDLQARLSLSPAMLVLLD
jgi:hypothetical protein